MTSPTTRSTARSPTYSTSVEASSASPPRWSSTIRMASTTPGEATRTPLSDTQLAEVETLVRQAMGYSEERGDALSVVNRPFTQPDALVEPTWWKDPMVHQLAKEIGRYLLILLAALLLYLLVLRPLIRRYTETPPAPAMPSAFSARVGDEEAEGEHKADGDSESGEDEAATYSRDNRRKRKANAYEQNLNDLREMAQEDPRLVAMIVRSWMNAND